MTVTTRPTPNPNSLKFEVDGATLTTERQLAYHSAREADEDDLARALFSIRGVESLLIVPTWVSVTKHAAGDWAVLAEAVEQVLVERLG